MCGSHWDGEKRTSEILGNSKGCATIAAQPCCLCSSQMLLEEAEKQFIAGIQGSLSMQPLQCQSGSSKTPKGEVLSLVTPERRKGRELSLHSGCCLQHALLSIHGQNRGSVGQRDRREGEEAQGPHVLCQLLLPSPEGTPARVHRQRRRHRQGQGKTWGKKGKKGEKLLGSSPLTGLNSAFRYSFYLITLSSESKMCHQISLLFFSVLLRGIGKGLGRLSCSAGFFSAALD